MTKTRKLRYRHTMSRNQLPRRSRLRQPFLQPSQLILAHHIHQAVVEVVRIGTAIRAEVGEENLEMLPKLLRPIHHLLIHGVMLDQCLQRYRNKIVGQGVIRIERLAEDFAEPPVVRDFMIIPLDVDGNFRQEALHFFVTVVVLPVRPEIDGMV
jgi:hypothetical protein